MRHDFDRHASWNIHGNLIVNVLGLVIIESHVFDHFTRGAAPMGWASTTALLLLLGGMILVVLGIMGEYVGRIYMCANAAPQYVEREVIRHEENDA